MRRVVILLAICGIAVLLFPAVLLFMAPSIQFPLLVVASLSMGGVIGILVRPTRLACVMAACALGVGAFVGVVISMESLFLRFGGTADWWRAAMAVSVIAGLLHGALATLTAAVVNLTFWSRARPVAEVRDT